MEDFLATHTSVKFWAGLAALTLAFFLLRLAGARRPNAKRYGLLVIFPMFAVVSELAERLFSDLPYFKLISDAAQYCLLAWFSVHIIVTLYIGTWLEGRRIVVNHILRDLIRFGIIIVFVLLYLRYGLRLNLATILTPSAILTAIIGLAMQDTIGNLISGILIQTEKPFEIGDWIDISGQVGLVREINWRYTKIETHNRLYIIIPNNKIATDRLINYSKPTRDVQLELDIGVSYDNPPFHVKKAVMEILLSHPGLVLKEHCAVRIVGYGDSAINYRIHCIVPDYSANRQVRDDIYSAIWYKFKKRDIDIPFPIRTVRIERDKADKDFSALRGTLRALPLLDGISEAGLDLFARHGMVREIESGATLVREGEPGESMFFVLDGSFRVVRNGAVINTLDAGACFGEMSLLTGEKRSASVEAGTRCRVLEVGRAFFKVVIEDEPILLQKIDALFEERAAFLKNTANPGESKEQIKAGLLESFRRLFGMA